MNPLSFAFFLFIFIIFYAYVGYAVLIYLLVKFKKNNNVIKTEYELPELSFIVPCYNEADIIREKIKNTLLLSYPENKLRIYFITDGCNDETVDIIAGYNNVTLLHKDERKGKAAAINRAMENIQTDIVCFSDANTFLPEDALLKMMRHYQSENVGAVSGEKRVIKQEKDNASAAGEGFYWKYESALKRMDSEYYSLVGAAGEFISFRKSLFTPLEEDSILDDFMISMRIAAKGYKVVYEPEAYAMETASASVKEELKRKVRICAGSWQSMLRLSNEITPFKNFKLFFLYYSHRVLRWSLVPVLLLLLIPINAALYQEGLIFKFFFWGQIAFYAAAFLGFFLESRKIRFKPLFIPYYFYVMNYAVFAGFFRFIKGKQAAAWERSKRAEHVA